MTIEVICTQCNARLRVPEEARGEQAKCPHCENIFDVVDKSPPVAMADTEQPVVSPPPTPPNPPTSDPFAETTPGPSRFGSDLEQQPNPYAAPLSEQPVDERSTAELQLGQLDAGTAAQIAWELVKANLPTLLLANGALVLASLVISGITSGVEELGNPGLSTLANLLGAAAQWFLGIGVTLINLNVARGKPADLGMLFSGGPWFIRIAIATVIYSLIVMIGMVALFVPGFYLASKFWAFHCFIIDRDCGVVEAFGQAGEYAEGNKVQAVVLMFLSVIIFVGGVLAFCVGVFFAMPVISMMWVIAYLMITRQPIQRPVR